MGRRASILAPPERSPTMIKIAILGMFLLWFFTTVLRQFVPSIGRRLGRISLLFPIPHWRLFSGPPSTDFQIHSRDRLSDGTVTDWQSVPLLPPWTLISYVWSPHISLAHFLWIGCSRIARTPDKGKPSGEFLRSYQAIWNFVRLQPRSPESRARQFRVSLCALGETDCSHTKPVESDFRLW